jgi:hypothetical protein
MSGAGGGGGAAAAPPPTATKQEDPFACGVDTVSLPGQRDKLYLLQDLVSRCGFQDAHGLLKRCVPEEERRVVLVGRKSHTAVTRAGADVLLRRLWAPGVAQAQADVEALAARLGIELEAGASSAPAAPAGAGGAADAADEDAPWPDGSEQPLQFSDDERDADDDEEEGWQTDEEAGAGEEARAPRRGYDDRAKPPTPSRAALEKYQRFHAYCLRRAQRAVWRASTTKGRKGLITVDPKRRLISTPEFWRVVGRAVPPLAFSVETKDGRVEVPRVSSYLLQDYLARTGLLAPSKLPRALNLARTELEVTFHQLTRAHTGTLLDLALHSLGHGASQAAVQMVAAVSGGNVSYTTARNALASAAKVHFDRAVDDMLNLPEGQVVVNKIDNYASNKGCVAWEGPP